MSRRRAGERLALLAREDARDAVRERQLHVLVGLFGLVGAFVAYSAGQNVAAIPPSDEVHLASRLIGSFSFLIPLVALGFVSPSLVQKRTTGGLAVLLGLPFSRLAVVLGTFVGRSIVVGGAVLVGALVVLPIGLLLGVPIAPFAFIGSAMALVVLAVTFTAIAVSISAIARTSTRATFAAFGAYVVFVLGLWDRFTLFVLYVRHGFAYPEPLPTWVDFVRSLNPMAAFGNGVAGAFPSLSVGTAGPSPTGPAIYELPAVALVVLVAWIAGALWVGYRRLRATDL